MAELGSWARLRLWEYSTLPLLIVLAELFVTLWWWCTPVGSIRGLRRVLEHPPARLPRVRGRLLRILTMEEPGWYAYYAITRCADRPAALRVYLQLPGVGEPEIRGAVRWLDALTLGDPAAARALLRHPACSDFLAARVVSECWFLGFNRVRELRSELGGRSYSSSRLLAAIELREEEDERRRLEAELRALIAPFPGASLLLEVISASSSITPHELMRCFEPACSLSLGAREVFSSLLADRVASDPYPSSPHLALAELLELLELADACLA